MRDESLKRRGLHEIYIIMPISSNVYFSLNSFSWQGIGSAGARVLTEILKIITGLRVLKYVHLLFY